MNVEEIRNLVELMDEFSLTEMKVESGEDRIFLRRGCDAAAPVVMPAVSALPAAPAAAAPAAPAAAAPAAAPAVPAVTIDSPLVGTFYKAASPDSAPFVQIGDRVNPDTTLCIIEAMKVMNEVKAEKSGVIKDILIENGQPVEFGQPMFVLE
ncbi:MAG: acetyl-CoA carboxylase biotin carboxyl carrier protein [Lentisphaerae bacterium]|nr:acetyl-CoA carboxylase biotin carboxyl carrier protein [Lentisphaerota bacterium]